ncbi:hypothetical protein QQP08_008271 [Theobroma cacao]|uniref:Uncharacterized protein LOC18609740 n=1 Tax=Theobroma cacao TaxID=3641 RepID=A0AB32VKX6_THECC|nr:PREDICTED: uncharacterized protein LOC18609740 [Theobroma cacao]WRX15784.1 hypothetical protein QQP08_008271 [Theobroma cacao]
MEATSSLCSTTSALSPRPFSGDPLCRRKGLGGEKRAVIKISASKRDAHGRDFDGKLVDESMIVLRKRIHEMSMLEKNHEPPEHWMEWEKQYKKADYDSDVCEAVGYLQSKLMETRPSVALGMGAALLFSVSTSTAVLLFHVMAVLKGL